MFRRKLLFVSLLVVSYISAAQGETYSATVTQPLAAKKEFIANGNLWRCSGTTCIMVSQPKDPGSLQSCLELKRRTGSLTTYGSKTHPFDAVKLSKCNSDG